MPRNADWGRDATNNHMITAVDLEHWAIIFVSKNRNNAQDFTSSMMQIGPQLGMRVAQPIIHQIDNDRTDAYITALKKLINPELQMVVTIFPTSRDDRYSAVKKHCCETSPIPSQVIKKLHIWVELQLHMIYLIFLRSNCLDLGDFCMTFC